ncbi:MAG: NTP/NDP exchange transporter, partial [Simkaniaceae bacterium]|nr:NTP/NDP exchange transporter [Simkaniaceae bacterium]
MSSSVKEFGRMRSFLWPIHRCEIKKFLPLLIIYALIVFNYCILKAAKDSLVITAQGSGAEAIPFIKVWAILPMAIIVTYFFTRLFNRLNQEQVFYIMIGCFLTFFLLFALVLYPMRESIHPHKFANFLETILPKGFQGLISIIRNWSYTLFYVMSELWGTTIMTVLFWGYTNEVTSVKDAKRFYAILGVGANIATIVSGQITVILSCQLFDLSWIFGQDEWGQSLGLITTAIIIAGLLAIAIFRWYNCKVLISKSSASLEKPRKKSKSEKISLKKSFSYLTKSKYLICIAIVVLGFNIAINMIEIVWKDQIKELYPNPNEFNAYMGKVYTAIGILSTFVGLFICGTVIRKFGWTVSALITPILILITGTLFFIFILFKDSNLGSFTLLMGTTPLALGVFFGSVQNALSRACKFTLFDATKEIAFIPLSSESKIKGKAAIDGVGSRLGKSGGSIVHQGLLLIFGSVSLSAPFVGVILLFVILGWVSAVKALGKQF